jgi:L-lactate dehydrogenase (cytochrome)
MKLKRQFPRYKDVAPLLKFKKPEANPTKRRLNSAYTMADIRRIAKRRTPSGPFNYVDGSAEDEVTIKKTRDYFRDIEFQPGILRDVSSADTRTVVMGKESALPFGFAPTGFTRMMHSAGERAVVRAAERTGIPYALSTMGTTSLEDVAAEAPGARKWFQLYLWKDRDRSRELLENAKRAGYDTLILTVDVPVAGNRVRDLRNGMVIPPELTLKTLIDASYRPEWWINFLTTEPLKFAFAADENAGVVADVVANLYDPSATFEYLHWMREAWGGPMVIKGIQTLDDAKRSVDFGADGLIVSNHGGRQLDRAPIPLRLLPEVVDAVGSQTEVMIDTGIMNGADVVASIALGAKFAWIGRAYLYGLMAGGEEGVVKTVEILESEIVRTMKLLGVNKISDLNPDHVRLLEQQGPRQAVRLVS